MALVVCDNNKNQTVAIPDPDTIFADLLQDLPSETAELALDASEISALGGKGAWRLHALMEVVTLQVVAVELTDLKTGETLCNFEFATGDVILTDRGYSHRQYTLTWRLWLPVP